MKRFVLITLFLLASLPALTSATEAEFALDVTIKEVTPAKAYIGDTVNVTLNIANVSESDGEKLWDATIFIDESILDETVRESITINDPDGAPIEYGGTQHPGDELWPGETTSAELSFTLDDDAPGGTYYIPFVITGKRGPCPQGCHPWRGEVVTLSLNVIHGLPALSLSVSSDNVAAEGETLNVDFSVRNLGSAPAYNVKAEVKSDYSSLVSQVNIPGDVDTLEPNDTLEGSVAIFTSSLGEGEYELRLDVSFVDTKGTQYVKQKTFSLSILPSQQASFEQQGDDTYEEGVALLETDDFKGAIMLFSQAKQLYVLSENDDKAAQCEQKIDDAYQQLEMALTPEPVEDNEYYLLLVGLFTGAAAAFLGLTAGMIRRRGSANK